MNADAAALRTPPTRRAARTARSARSARTARTGQTGQTGRTARCVRLGGPRGRALGFAVIGLSGFAPNLGVLWLLTTWSALPVTLAVVTANQAAIVWNFLLTDRLLYRAARSGAPDRRGARADAGEPAPGAGPLPRGPWIRLAAYAGLSNTDLLVRVPLTHWLVAGLGGEPVAVTAALLVTLAAVRFLAVDRLLYRAKKRSDHDVPT